MSGNNKSDNNNASRGLWVALAGLTAFAGLAGLAVSYTAQSTRERIQANQLAHAMRVVAEVLPAERYNNEPHQEPVMLRGPDWLGTTRALPAYRARMDTTPVATAITIIAPDGYVGEIRVLVGIDSNDRIVRARVLEHRETPGLGDKIDATKSNWINQFDNRQLAESSWTLERDGGDIDHITGATITSRAVVNAIRRALELQRIYGARISESPAESELELAAPEAAN